jgi:hypothetical protein
MQSIFFTERTDPMRTNTVRQKLKVGQPVIGYFMGLGNPQG